MFKQLNLFGNQGVDLYESFKWETNEDKSLENLLKKFDDHMELEMTMSLSTGMHFGHLIRKKVNLLMNILKI